MDAGQRGVVNMPITAYNRVKHQFTARLTERMPVLKSGECVLCKVHQKSPIFPPKSPMFPKDACNKVGRMCSVQGTSL